MLTKKQFLGELKSHLANSTNWQVVGKNPYSLQQRFLISEMFTGDQDKYIKPIIKDDVTIGFRLRVPVVLSQNAVPTDLLSLVRKTSNVVNTGRKVYAFCTSFATTMEDLKTELLSYPEQTYCAELRSNHWAALVDEKLEQYLNETSGDISLIIENITGDFIKSSAEDADGIKYSFDDEDGFVRDDAGSILYRRYRLLSNNLPDELKHTRYEYFVPSIVPKPADPKLSGKKIGK
jgi:hypothetical protein